MPAPPPIPSLFVDHSGPALSNVGDLAMLMVAVRRLQEAFPGATLHVPTHDAARLQRFCPGTHPIPEHALSLLFWRRVLPSGVSTRIPFLGRAETWWRHQHPVNHLRAVALRNRLRHERPAGTDDALAAIRTASAFVAAGGGYVNDLFPGHLERVLGVLRIADARGCPFALLGQGLGPVDDPARRRAVAGMLRQARVIGLREKVEGPALLEALLEALLPRGRTIPGCVTGDDAIELAWEHRASRAGTHLGCNIRLARYSGVDDSLLGRVRDALGKFLAARHATAVACPISFGSGDHDPRAIATLLEGLPVAETAPCTDDPLDVIQRVGDCRTVVTGSYHAAVFALAQGIPVLGLARTPYYHAKFQGLASLFGEGCRSLSLQDEDFTAAFASHLGELWDRAAELRPTLLAAAQRQIWFGRELYRELPRALARP